MLETVGAFNSGSAAGGAGVSTANQTGTTQLRGMLVGFYVKYNGTPPATTDVTIEATGGVLPTRTLLTLTDKNTSGFFPVVQQAVDLAGANAAGWFAGVPLIDDKLKITIAQANVGNSVDVYPIIMRGY